MLRVAFVLRSTEVHPEFFGFVHTNICPQLVLGGLKLSSLFFGKGGQKTEGETLHQNQNSTSSPLFFLEATKTPREAHQRPPLFRDILSRLAAAEVPVINHTSMGSPYTQGCS